MSRFTNTKTIEKYISEKSNGRLDYHNSLLNHYRGFLCIEDDLEARLMERIQAPNPTVALQFLIEDLKDEVSPKNDPEDYILTHAYQTSLENRSWTLEYFFQTRTLDVPTIEDVNTAAQAVEYAYFIARLEQSSTEFSEIQSEPVMNEEQKASFFAYAAWMHELGLLEAVRTACGNDMSKAAKILTEISNFNFRGDTLRTYMRGILSNDKGHNNPFTKRSREYIQAQKRDYKME